MSYPSAHLLPDDRGDLGAGRQYGIKGARNSSLECRECSAQHTTHSVLHTAHAPHTHTIITSTHCHFGRLLPQFPEAVHVVHVFHKPHQLSPSQLLDTYTQTERARGDLTGDVCSRNRPTSSQFCCTNIEKF
jgi:hypothetical protein